MGILYGVGVGPGDPEYMTLKAVRIIKECDMIVLPNKHKEDCYAYRIAKQVIPEIDDKMIVCYDFPMGKDMEKLQQVHDAIYQNVWQYLQMGKNIAFLTIGDPSVYSTYHYIHDRVIDNGGNVQMISGVPSFCAVAARLGISLGKNHEEIHILSGSYEESLLEDNLSGTRIYMKAGKKLEALLTHLEQVAAKKPLKICGVSNCGLENEIIYHDFQELQNSGKTDYLTIVIVKEE